jgi:hypothetical protein
MGPSGIDHEIDRLKDELEVILARAHKKYAACKRFEQTQFCQRAPRAE